MGVDSEYGCVVVGIDLEPLWSSGGFVDGGSWGMA